MIDRAHGLPIALILAFSLAAAGCAGRTSGPAASGPAPSGTIVRAAMVTDVGGLGDKSFNDSAYAGLKQARDVLH
ncbi:MAG: BMP family ABC transporter substrate-binding protein, partial [Candidatus Eremiobacteraeota bacterium]|nr:BMP family ABC transporter substrate-binding protein [Candidatus Eremiobacteraeota bacterium]